MLASFKFRNRNGSLCKFVSSCLRKMQIYLRSRALDIFAPQKFWQFKTRLLIYLFSSINLFFFLWNINRAGGDESGRSVNLSGGKNDFSSNLSTSLIGNVSFMRSWGFLWQYFWLLKKFVYFRVSKLTLSSRKGQCFSSIIFFDLK